VTSEQATLRIETERLSHRWHIEDAPKLADALARCLTIV